MITANISKTKNELSRFLEAVRGGETVVILDRNRPIAQIQPLSDESGGRVSSSGRVGGRRVDRATESINRILDGSIAASGGTCG